MGGKYFLPVPIKNFLSHRDCTTLSNPVALNGNAVSSQLSGDQAKARDTRHLTSVTLKLTGSPLHASHKCQIFTKMENHDRNLEPKSQIIFCPVLMYSWSSKSRLSQLRVKNIWEKNLHIYRTCITFFLVITL